MKVKWTPCFVLLIVTMIIMLTCTITLGAWLMREYQAVYNNYDMDNFQYNNSKKGAIYSADGVLLTYLYQLNKDHVRLQQIAKPMQRAVIAIEDHRFNRHFGFDTLGTLRALYKDLTSGQAVEGGSTITQQLARNLFLSPEKTISRKITETFLAIQLERKFTKAEILEMYLNEIYFGNGCYGVESAAQMYFGKSASELNLAEATMLAAIPKAPSYYEPLHHRPENKERQELVLRRMVDLSLISQQEMTEILTQDVQVNQFTPRAELVTYKFPYFTTEVVNQLLTMYGKEKVYNSGLKVITTLDSRAAQIAENIAKAKVEQFQRSGITASNISLVTVNNQTGAVMAMVGGYDFNQDQNNLAMIPRQPGSAIKPIHYAGAIDKGIINENTLLNAGSKSFGNYRVTSNIDADVSVMVALKNSMNVPAVEVVNTLGINNTLANLKKFGITTLSEYDCNLAIALGGMYYGIKPTEMAAAFAAFANNGQYNKPYLITSIEDNLGNVVYLHQPEPRQIISSKTAKIITQILLQAVRGGTGTRANISGNEAGKTGTTNDSRCLWFVGYTKEISTAVWVGNSNNRSVGGFYGGDLAAPTWREYNLALIKQGIMKSPVRIYEQEIPMKQEMIEKPKEEVIPEQPTQAQPTQQENPSQAQQPTPPEIILPEQPPKIEDNQEDANTAPNNNPTNPPERESPEAAMPPEESSSSSQAQ
ncbi:transglycosylase domain-containing protein [Desulforamulus aeronauticus]|uniref:Penicillin-binding protein 1A n=1 Tax=Desulforamulus aeronauticus DSM 10349 TaxID=1121421 RepID=A0A1M6ND09_9FIRM|nr:PBP1A family penicillin-binding protein [Desulforamulus aeronauticus]SHJ93638.1 penicillin-binding protein 1A [Desulforamulus aeronauticus DSM 10349]